MKTEFKILKEWSDDLIMCPSQCYLWFNYLGGIHCIYLRWRHGDPWGATLVTPCVKVSEDICNEKPWIPLQIDYFTHDELQMCKDDAIELAKQFLEKQA